MQDPVQCAQVQYSGGSVGVGGDQLGLAETSGGRRKCARPAGISGKQRGPAHKCQATWG